MKKMIFAFVVFCLLAINAYSQKCKHYKIIKIDSTSSTYLVYTKRFLKKDIFVSPKAEIDSLLKRNEKIVIKKKYYLCPEEDIDNQGDLAFGKRHYNIMIDGKFIRTNRNKKNNIYYSDNLAGLHYVKNPRYR